MNSHYDIFISYRRTDGKDIARTLKESLTRLGYRVFLDFDELQDGVFDQRILSAIDAAPIFMIILSEHCLDRCSHEDDWVRLELEYALRAGKQIVPINPDNQFKRFPDDVPEAIRKGLGQHQYSAVDTGQLYQASIEQLDKNRLQPILRKRRWRIWFPVMITAAVLSLISAMIFVRYQRDLPNRYYAKALYYNTIGEPTYNRDSAFYWLDKAAEAGLPAAQRDLAILYLYSTDVNNSEELAFYWFQKAYLSGDTLSATLLGKCYEAGIGIPQDLTEAVKLYREGTELGDPLAQYNLGCCIRDGVGLKRDYVEGMRNIVEASRKGNSVVAGAVPDGESWIFSPHADSIRHKPTQLRALQFTDSSTVAYLRWTNNRYFGGWMQVCREAYVEDAQSGARYTVERLIDAKFAPDTTSVEFGMSHDFALVFPALPSDVNIINLCESDTSLWQWFGIRIDR